MRLKESILSARLKTRIEREAARLEPSFKEVALIAREFAERPPGRVVSLFKDVEYSNLGIAGVNSRPKNDLSRFERKSVQGEEEDMHKLAGRRWQI